MKFFLCIDLKGFYASVECILRNLNPLKDSLVVADASRGPFSIVLAVSPYLKSLGVKTRCRLYEIPKDIHYVIARPQMKKYISISSEIYGIYLKYVSSEDIHVYSIDEAFLELSNYMNYYKKDIKAIALEILEEIFEKTRITAVCGIGTNMYLAKIALDILAKKNPTNLDFLDEEKYCEKLWEYKPLSDFWSIGENTQRHLHELGFHTMKEIALGDGQLLRDEFGIIGNQIYNHAWGQDFTTIKDIQKYQPLKRSLGHSQVLPMNYSKNDVKIVLSEMVELIVYDLISEELKCNTIHLFICYAKKNLKVFNKQMKLSEETNLKSYLYNHYLQLFSLVLDESIRKIGLRVSGLTSSRYRQLSLFSNDKELNLHKAIVEIKNKHGSMAIDKAVSHLKQATAKKRSKLIGGHHE